MKTLSTNFFSSKLFTKKLPLFMAVSLLMLSLLGLAGCSNTKTGSNGTTGAGTGTPTSYGSGSNGTGTYTSNGTGTSGSYGTSNTGSYTGSGAQNYGSSGNSSNYGSYGTSGGNSLTTDLNDIGRDISNGINSMRSNLSADM